VERLREHPTLTLALALRLNARSKESFVDMSKGDSGVKYLFAGLLLVVGLILIALFWQPFYIWVRYHNPAPVGVEDVARDRLPEGAQVSVQGVLDPRHSYVVKEPGGERWMEISLLLDDDTYMEQWRQAMDRDATAFRKHLTPALEDELVKRDLKEFMESMDAYDGRWNKYATQLNKTIRDTWPGYAVGLARICDECTEEGFHKKSHPERNWLLDDFQPPGGPKERPAWPEDIVVSNPIKRSEMPILRGYLEGEAAYYKEAALQAAAELKAFDHETSFGRQTTVVGCVRPLPTGAFDAFEAIDDLSFDVYFYVREGEVPATYGMIVVPIGLVLAGLMALLMLKWAVFGKKGYQAMVD